MSLVKVVDLQPGMIINKDVFIEGQKLPLIPAGTSITSKVKTKLLSKNIFEVEIFDHQEVFDQLLKSTGDSIKELFDNIRTGNRNIEYDKISPISNAIIEEMLKNGDLLIKELFLLKQHHEYTFHHSVATAIYSCLLGIALDYPQQKLELLTNGAVLHDIGKAFIPLEIIEKPGSLTVTERELMNNHCQLGYSLLNNNFPQEICKMVLEHHEQKNGQGYPQKLQGHQISTLAKICAIADKFSALTTDRSYRKRLSPFLAADYLYNYTLFALDTNYTKVFIQQILGPLENTWVILNTDESALIVEENSFIPTQPKVVVYHDEKPVKGIDLARDKNYFIVEQIRHKEDGA